MKILQSDLAVTKHPIKKVRFERKHFRGRPVEKAIIYEVIEQKPAAFMANGSLICHPALYRRFRAMVDVHNSEQGTFAMPPKMPPMTIESVRENFYKYRSYSFDMMPSGIGLFGALATN